MTDYRQKLGRKGEELAAEFLQRQGYRILERNYRRYRGEIDLIARDGNCLVFVEVKTVRGQRFGHPILKVDRRKREQLGRIALAYFQEHELFDQESRFDVVTVQFLGGEPVIEHWKNAFWLEAPP
ncbi:MAG TPA: YraN family protein [Bacteroidetes bacterium]|nr:YraN family protein [Bacteroidota bacterium]